MASGTTQAASRGQQGGAPEISLEKLSFSYAGRPLFQDFSLKAAAGRWTCILGPSGCGKSTLLRLISGGIPMAKGSISFDGRALAPGQVAWMAQKDLLLPWLTVLDNLILGARLRGGAGPALEQKALALLEQAGLEGQARALPNTLSGGMRQRAALLRTLLEGRPVILMDEPFSALDALTRLKLQNLAAGMLRGATVLLVTHDPWEALRLGHRIYVIKGRPARLSPGFSPPGEAPRDPARESMVAMYTELLAHLDESPGSCA